MELNGRRILVTGGTGSLGSTLVRKVMDGAYGMPERVTVFSRDEDKQHTMRLHYERHAHTNGAKRRPELRFHVGDVRSYASVAGALRQADVVFHTAALKQVPNCEYAPDQAVQTNVLGARNIVRAIAEQALHVELVVGISTDKACEPVNVMGMTKALQERILVEGNLECKNTRLVCVRYGNVIASRGSVVPIFVRQIREGGPVTITTPQMTRFLITLDQAVETVMAAVRSARPGETYVPKLPAARVVDVAHVLMGAQSVPIIYAGIRPGEKIHELLVSGAERFRTIERDGHYVICPMLPELAGNAPIVPALDEPFTSQAVTYTFAELQELLADYVPRAAPGPRLVLAG